MGTNAKNISVKVLRLIVFLCVIAFADVWFVAWNARGETVVVKEWDDKPQKSVPAAVLQKR